MPFFAKLPLFSTPGVKRVRLFRRKPVETAPETPPDSGIRLSPIAELVVADAVVRAGQALVRRGVEQQLLRGRTAQTGRVLRGRTVKETVIGTVLAEIARRSVPGAILVGGGLLAQALRDQRRARTKTGKNQI
jgi:hypothetical protein